MCSSLDSSCSSSEAATGDVLKKGALKNSTKFTWASVFFLTLLFFLVRCEEIWLGSIHQLTSAGRLL